ncbi:metal tolerance protein C4-like [Zingiber officinale]|uniref:metal tolerance protein C4-like n=1 Tax=Zingiber officinale TaxID=94328 RepID=UPI001C4CA1C8|nr:metal tolerance protein C4-like [Zingiber officinale]XP_042408738.1 metal tolerance protein C4-like [Zingiber officinale]
MWLTTSSHVMLTEVVHSAADLANQVWAQRVVHGMQNLWKAHPPENMHYAALVICGSFLVECAWLLVAINAVKKGAAAEGMKLWDYVWHGHDPTSVAVMTEVVDFRYDCNSEVIGQSRNSFGKQSLKTTMHF